VTNDYNIHIVTVSSAADRNYRIGSDEKINNKEEKKNEENYQREAI
jgi:hypothetical protein